MHWLVAIGSLMDPASTALTIGRTPEIVTAWVHGWARDWNVSVDNTQAGLYVCTGCRGRPGAVAFLDAQPSSTGAFHAGALHVSDRELALLDARELMYRRVRVPARIDGHVRYAWMYSGEAVHRDAVDVVVAQSYIRTVERGAARVRSVWSLPTVPHPIVALTSTRNTRVAAVHVPCPCHAVTYSVM